jgi:hypothetical protein
LAQTDIYISLKKRAKSEKAKVRINREYISKKEVKKMLTIEEAEKIFYKICFEKKTYKILEKEMSLGSGKLFSEMKKFRGHFKIRENERYCKLTYLRYKYGEEIKEKYLKGISTMTLAKAYSYNDHGIAQLLESMGIEIRSVGYIGKTSQDIFSKIDNREKAYTIGLITADGSVNKKGNLTICLTESDKYLLEEINEKIFLSTGTIFLSHKEDVRPRAVLSVNGKKLCSDLEKYGIVPNKTYTLLSISDLIPEEYYPDYIRGLYDGDGVCSKNNNTLRIGYCSHNIEFTTSYRDYLCEKLKMRKNKLFNTGGCWQCSWGARADLEKFYSFIYNSSDLFLKRKKEKLENYLF